MGSSLREQTTPAAGEERIDSCGIPEFLRRAFSKFFREGTAIQVEIICQFLSVKRNLKDRAFGFGRLRGQIDQQTSPDGLWGCAENPVGQDEIFVNGNSKEILHDLVRPESIFIAGLHQSLQIQEKKICIFSGYCIHHQRLLTKSVGFCKYLSCRDVAQQTFISPEIYIFDINTSRQNNSDFSDGFSHSKNKFIFSKDC